MFLVRDDYLTNPKNNAIVKEITKTQADFLEFLEEYGWGKVEVTVKNGEPVMSKELVKEHKHD